MKGSGTAQAGCEVAAKCAPDHPQRLQQRCLHSVIDENVPVLAGARGLLRRAPLPSVLLLGMSALGALPAYGTSPGKNGQIAFHHAGSYLWIINPDGTGERKLTDVRGAEDANPD
jgi:hypothetical protein